MTEEQKEAKRLADREYYHKNKEKCNERNLRYYENHKERIKENGAKNNKKRQNTTKNDKKRKSTTKKHDKKSAQPDAFRSKTDNSSTFSLGKRQKRGRRQKSRRR